MDEKKLRKIQRINILCISLLLLVSVISKSVNASPSVRIAVLSFKSLDIDTSLSQAAEETAKRIMLNEGSFEFVHMPDGAIPFHPQKYNFLEREVLQDLMKKYGAEMTVEGLLRKSEEDQVEIQIQITARSSTWRPPTVLSAKASVPEYVNPRVERLIRQFLNRYYDEQSMERFFQSALVPGFGQFREGYTRRAGFFFFGTVGLVAGSFLLSDGDSYSGQGTVEFKKGADGSIRWLIGDTPVSPEEAEAELQRRTDAEDSREKAERRRLFLLGAGIALYAVNLYDILKITKRYDRVESSRFSLHLNPFYPEKAIRLNCSFDM